MSATNDKFTDTAATACFSIRVSCFLNCKNEVNIGKNKEGNRRRTKFGCALNLIPLGNLILIGIRSNCLTFDALTAIGDSLFAGDTFGSLSLLSRLADRLR